MFPAFSSFPKLITKGTFYLSRSPLSGPLGGISFPFSHVSGLVQSDSRHRKNKLEGVTSAELVPELNFVGENLGKKKERKKLEGLFINDLRESGQRSHVVSGEWVIHSGTICGRENRGGCGSVGYAFDYL